MSKVNMIHHVNIQITNRERTREWYEKVLGFASRTGDRPEPPDGSACASETARSTPQRLTSRVHPAVHFAVEVDDWDAALANLDKHGVHYSRTGGGAFMGTGGDDERHGRREDTNEHYTYVSDPDGNLIELVYHPLGLQSTEGDAIPLHRDTENPKWTQIPGFVEEAYKGAEITV